MTSDAGKRSASGTLVDCPQCGGIGSITDYVNNVSECDTCHGAKKCSESDYWAFWDMINALNKEMDNGLGL